MNKLDTDLSRKIKVVNELGLHARPAAKIAAAASKASSHVWLIKNGEKVDASSVIDILSLGCAMDSSVTIQIDLPEDKIILNEIVDLFAQGFKEPS